MPVAVARCGNIYGGGDLNWSRLIPGTIASLVRGEPPVIRSDGKYLRDYVYVEDVVDAYLLMAENAGRKDVAGNAFNFGPNRPATVLDVVTTIARIMGRDDLKPRIVNDAQHEIRDQYLDSSKAKQVLDWSPKTDLESGLRRTIDWYRQYLKPENV
jgi:CDP-glucose 4,6-dehydratase